MKSATLSFDKNQKAWLLKFPEGDFAGKTYAVKFNICLDPFCSCRDADFFCQLLTEDGQMASPDAAPLAFTLDIIKRCIAETQPHPMDAESMALAKSIATELCAASWDNLYYLVGTLKELSFAEKPIIKSPIQLPKNILANPNLSLAWQEVFPGLPLMEFKLAGGHWLVDEQYCIKPDCNCTDAILTFLYVDADSTELNAKESPTARFNYKTSCFQVMHDSAIGQPPIDMLVQGMKGRYPGLEIKLEMHHSYLRLAWLRNCIQRKPVNPNAPCPCGSGKKYKKCCGK